MDKLSLSNYSSGNSFSALKGGALLIGLELGLLIGFIICMNHIPDYLETIKNWEYSQVTGIIYGSSILIFGGLGLILAFIIEVKLRNFRSKE